MGPGYTEHTGPRYTDHTGPGYTEHRTQEHLTTQDPGTLVVVDIHIQLIDPGDTQTL